MMRFLKNWRYFNKYKSKKGNCLQYKLKDALGPSKNKLRIARIFFLKSSRDVTKANISHKNDNSLKLLF